MSALHRNAPQSARRRHRQAGYSLIEFSAVAAPLLMAGLGSVELAHWFFIKQAVSLALLEAGRAGITRHAHPQAMETAFEQALLALYPASGGRSSAQKLQHALQQRSRDTGGPPWQIEILQPGPADFADFGSTRLAVSAKHGGLAAIDNNYQAEQHRRYIERGWAQGRGPASGASIYEANTLALRLTYLYEPALPGLKGLIRQLASGAGGYGARAMSSAGYLPMRQEIRLTMQTHALQWPASGKGKVTGQAAPTPPGTTSTAPCAGIWCLGNESETAGARPPDPPENSAAEEPGPPPGHENSLPGSDRIPDSQDGAGGVDATTPQAEDPECGVTLCCLPDV